ncbi:hypothetical protein PNI0007_01304, partial [Streptococcus pneumoniae PNI0007]
KIFSSWRKGTTSLLSLQESFQIMFMLVINGCGFVFLKDGSS